MAITEASSYTVLDPKASPYNKIPPTHFFVYVFPHPPAPAYVHEFPPAMASPLVSTYNIRFQPSVRISFPISLSSHPSRWSEKNTTVNFSLTPVPSGPRIQNSRFPERRQRFTTVVRFRNSGKRGDEMKWRPKVVESKAVVDKEEGKTRWKNKRGENESFLPLEAKTTSVMIKNIPNKYTRKLLIKTLDNHCEIENKKLNNGGSVAEDKIISAYDFVYLPIDFNRRLNAGFAFVNFTNPEAALRFRDAFHGKHWEFFNSPKIAEISRARIQGKVALINHCKSIDFSYGSKEDMPVWFEPARNGSGGFGSKMHTVGKSHLKSWF